MSIITTNNAGCRETVIHGVNGFLCEKRSVADLYEKNLLFLKSDASEKVEMGRHSRILAERKFHEWVIIDQYLADIEILSDARRSTQS